MAISPIGHLERFCLFEEVPFKLRAKDRALGRWVVEREIFQVNGAGPEAVGRRLGSLREAGLG